MTINSPRVKPHLSVEIVDAEHVFLLDEARTHILDGDVYPKLMPLLDVGRARRARVALDRQPYTITLAFERRRARAGSLAHVERPATSGVIAGGPVRAVVTAAGIPNVLTKSIGTHNPHNVVKATIVALESLREKGAIAEMRGLAVEKL